METKPKFIIRHYKSIASEYEIINAWKESEKFPYTTATTTEQEHLEKLSVLELIFSKEEDREISFNSLFESLEQLIKNLVIPFVEPLYIGFAEHKVKEVNRLRSYKGILPKWAANKETGIQKEVMISHNQSIIVAMIKVEKINSKDALKFFTDGEALFMISTDENIMTERYLDVIAGECMNHKGTSIVNFITLLNLFNNSENILFRRGGDGGNRYVSLQVFCHKEKIDFLLDKVNSIMLAYNKL